MIKPKEDWKEKIINECSDDYEKYGDELRTVKLAISKTGEHLAKIMVHDSAYTDVRDLFKNEIKKARQETAKKIFDKIKSVEFGDGTHDVMHISRKDFEEIKKKHLGGEK